MTEKKSTKFFILNSFLKKNDGYTLVDMLVAVAVFSIAVGTAIGIFIAAIRNQKQVLDHQQILDQTSYVLEYIGRALRMALKELSTSPSCLSQRGLNYEITREGKGIKFINYKGECQEFFLENGRLKESKSGKENYLTSDKLEIASFSLNLIGGSQDDNLQPRVTFSLDIEAKTLSKPPRLKIQTTISQRNLDVRY